MVAAFVVAVFVAVFAHVIIAHFKLVVACFAVAQFMVAHLGTLHYVAPPCNGGHPFQLEATTPVYAALRLLSSNSMPALTKTDQVGYPPPTWLSRGKVVRRTEASYASVCFSNELSSRVHISYTSCGTSGKRHDFASDTPQEESGSIASVHDAKKNITANIADIFAPTTSEDIEIVHKRLSLL